MKTISSLKFQDLSETFVHITKLQILINISNSIKYYKLFQIEILRITQSFLTMFLNY